MREKHFNTALKIAYDGTHYHGWQIQPNALTIQEVLQNALKILHRHEIFVVGSGRTDAHVHAIEQTAHYHHQNEVDYQRLLAGINALIPNDIRVLSAAPMPLDFHARYSALGKIYHYHLFVGPFMDPFRRHYAWHIREKLNIDLLKQAAALFVGTHDFTSFANEAHRGTAAHDAVRTLKRLDVMIEGDWLRLEFEADGFLYKMVRNIVGMLYDIARGKRSLNDIQAVLERRDRRLAAMACPPQGLFLVKVHY